MDSYFLQYLSILSKKQRTLSVYNPSTDSRNSFSCE